MLFGKNATAGLINIVTNRPDLRNDWLWRVSAFARNLFDEHCVAAVFGTPLFAAPPYW